MSAMYQTYLTTIKVIQPMHARLNWLYSVCSVVQDSIFILKIQDSILSILYLQDIFEKGRYFSQDTF